MSSTTVATPPEEFFKLIDSYSAPRLSGLRGALAAEPQVSVRFNVSRLGSLPAAVAALDAVPWCNAGYYLPERPSFTLDPMLHQGLYYVQEASSMFVAHVVKTLTHGSPPLVVLDACAAPGGKTTAAAGELPPGSIMVANEIDRARCGVLRENIAKWGNPMIRVINADTAQIAKRAPLVFDLVIADVPCSGEGMMRKDPGACAQWSLDLVSQCTRRQRTIVDNLWHTMRPGAYMVYSTCTFNRNENEEMIAYLVEQLGAESIAIDYPEEWGINPGINTPYHCMRFIPGCVRGEGLFMAVVRKPLSSADAPAAIGKAKVKGRTGGNKPSPKVDLTMASKLLAIDADLTVAADTILAFPHSPLTHRLPEEMRPRLEMGTMRGRDIIPCQELALSTALCRGTIAETEVSALEALQYLRGNAITLPDTAPRGLILLTHGAMPLGWAKNLGTRANCLYPKAWRVLKFGKPEKIF